MNMCYSGTLAGWCLCCVGSYTVYHGEHINTDELLLIGPVTFNRTRAVGAYKQYKCWVIWFCFLKKLLLICVAVFGIWYPTPYGEQAVHHESRRIRLRHSQHLPGYRLHLLLFPPDLWNKARVNLSTRAAPITEM